MKEKELFITPTRLDFATVLTSQTRTLQLAIRNLGDQDLEISSITGGGDVFSFPDSLSSFVLGRRSRQPIPVIYNPTIANSTDIDSLVIVTPDSTISVMLTGSSTNEIAMKEYSNDSHTQLLFNLNP